MYVNALEQSVIGYYHLYPCCYYNKRWCYVTLFLDGICEYYTKFSQGIVFTLICYWLILLLSNNNVSNNFLFYIDYRDRFICRFDFFFNCVIKTGILCLILFGLNYPTK